MSTNNIMKFCPYCGSEIIANARFCINCGSDLKTIYDELKANEKEDIPQKKNLNKNIKETAYQDNINSSNETLNKPNKDFSLLNNSKYEQDTNNNFDVVRPATSDYNNQPTNNIKANNQEKYMQYEQKNNVNPVIYSEYSCPLCEDTMIKTFKSGLLSKSTFHSCNHCFLTFKEQHNQLTLEDEPNFTRIHSKLHNKKYTYDEWKKLFKGGYLTDVFKTSFTWKLEAPTPINCPACNHQFNRHNKSGSHYLICQGCFLTLQEHKNGQYSLYDCIENFSPLWKYEKSRLTLEQMRNIIQNEQSDETKIFRQAFVQKNEKRIQEEENKLKQEQHDLELFNQSLSSGKPLLPAPTDTIIVLKKNEVPIYKINNVSLSEPRAVRTSKGRYGGASVRVMKGVTLHSGTSTSTSTSHDEIKFIDRGELLITNKRIVFLGQNRTTNIDLNKIIAITTRNNEIQVQRSNKQKPEYFTNINSTQNVMIDGRSYTVDINADMVKKLIMGLV